MNKELLIAESLLDWLKIKMRALRLRDFSNDEREKKYKIVVSFIKAYWARDERLSGLLLQEEWLKVRKGAFSKERYLY